MSFWYGLSFDDVADMPMAAIKEYVKRLEQRFAELKMNLVEPMTYPHMKLNDQRSLLKQWERSVGTKMLAKIPSPARLKMMGIGIQFIPISDEGHGQEQ